MNKKLIAECLKWAIEESGRIGGNHDNDAEIMSNNDSYEKIVDDYKDKIKVITLRVYTVYSSGPHLSFLNCSPRSFGWCLCA
jgi:hypothetical protein